MNITMRMFYCRFFLNGFSASVTKKTLIISQRFWKTFLENIQFFCGNVSIPQNESSEDHKAH